MFDSISGPEEVIRTIQNFILNGLPLSWQVPECDCSGSNHLQLIAFPRRYAVTTVLCLCIVLSEDELKFRIPANKITHPFFMDDL